MSSLSDPQVAFSAMIIAGNLQYCRPSILNMPRPSECRAKQSPQRSLAKAAGQWLDPIRRQLQTDWAGTPRFYKCGGFEYGASHFRKFATSAIGDVRVRFDPRHLSGTAKNRGAAGSPEMSLTGSQDHTLTNPKIGPTIGVHRTSS